MMKKLLWCAASWMMFLPQAQAAQAAPKSSAAETPVTSARYVMKAGAGDLYEIESSRLALQKSRDSAVKEFAQMMIDHHTQTTRQVTDAARAAGLKPMPPKLEPEQARMIAQLKAAPAASFDARYIEQQRKAHQMALALHQGYAKQGDSVPLRNAAKSAVPVVEQHISRLDALKPGQGAGR